MTQAVAELSCFMHIYNYLAKTLHSSGCCDLHSPATIELMQGNFHCTAIPLPLHNKHCIALSSLAKMLLMSCHANHINQQLFGWLNMQNWCYQHSINFNLFRTKIMIFKGYMWYFLFCWEIPKTYQCHSGRTSSTMWKQGDTLVMEIVQSSH